MTTPNTSYIDEAGVIMMEMITVFMFRSHPSDPVKPDILNNCHEMNIFKNGTVY